MNRPSTADAVSEQAAKDLEVVTKEAKRWMEAVTGREMRLTFRESLEDGVILCELMQKISPGSIKKINRRQVAIAHLDNIRQFLAACEGLGLKGSQLFDLTDLQAPGTIKMRSGGVKQTTAERRLSNVCITIYWLGRKVAQMSDFPGPQLNLDAFQQILNIPSTAYMLQGYETEKPYTSPNFTQEKQKFDWSIPHESSRQNGKMSPEQEADELLASIQNQVDEMLLEFQPDQVNESMPPKGNTGPARGPQMRQERVVVQETQLMQEPMLDYPDASSLTPTTPPPPPDEVFVTIDMITHSGSFGLQLLGGADTGIPAQVELVVPGRPADIGGVCPGDMIVSVNDIDATDLTHVELTELIKQGGSRGHLSLGIIRRVPENASDFSEEEEEQEMEIPVPPTFSSKVSQEIWEEEHAERERQRMEVAMLYGGRKNGLSPLTEESHSSQQEHPESEAPGGSSARYSNHVEEKQEEKQEKVAEPRNYKSVTTYMESTRDFEEELHQLDLLVQQSRSPESVSKPVPFQLHEWKEPITHTPPSQIHLPNESIGDEGNEEEEEEHAKEMEEGQSHSSSTPYTHLPNAVNTVHTDGHSQHSDHSHSSDPFAPLQSPPETTAPLLTEVLSAHSSYSESLPSKTLVTDISEASSLPGPIKVGSSHQEPIPQVSNSSQEHTPHMPDLPIKSKNRETAHKSTPSRIKKLEVPTEVQEVGNGIRVRAVQRTRWTPEASDFQSRLEESEGHNVVTTEHNRRWTYDGARGKPFAKERSRTLQQTYLCSYCRAPIAKGSMMSIPTQQLYYHPKCLVCVVCRSRLNAGYGHTTVFLRHSLPHCASCYSTDDGIKATTC